MIAIDQDLIREVLKLPEGFVDDGHLPLGETWSLGPCVDTRDSDDLLGQTNVAALLKDLAARPEFEGQWEIVHADHWACGWVSHLAFRAVDDRGEPTLIFRFLLAWNDRLDGCADEEDYSRRQYERALERIDWHRPAGCEGPEDMNARIFGWLWENTTMDTENNGHYFITEGEVREACLELGYLEVEHDQLRAAPKPTLPPATGTAEDGSSRAPEASEDQPPQADSREATP